MFSINIVILVNEISIELCRFNFIKYIERTVEIEREIRYTVEKYSVH